ncbi:MAG: hypothetical protein NVV82_01240 [Sporocytophaga sp.]|nr:hypothetical protein [Sporocytophaga sp.]MCR6637643.1 hypothetical protein [Sporocytophaga sp.]
MANSKQSTDNIAIVHSCFNITNRGIIVELQHNLDGLAQGFSKEPSITNIL